ncbi:MAG: hypothetical protein OK439_05090, partial [Thaumarchaeota archaeon]|nr:hypothetical protein [Nitrososphaerota archaeon]
ARREWRNAKYEKQLKEDSKRFTPIIKKIVLELALEHLEDEELENFQFSSHVINRKIREQLGDVFDETLAMRTFVAMKELTKSWILKREIQPTKNIWSVNLKDARRELNPSLKTISKRESVKMAPVIGTRKRMKSG